MSRYDPERRAAQPSRVARRTGYRTDAARKRAARLKLDAQRRAEIASLGGQARAAIYGHPADRRVARRLLATLQTQRAASRPAVAKLQAQVAAIALTPAARKAAAAARAAASRPGRRRAQRAREAAARAKGKP